MDKGSFAVRREQWKKIVINCNNREEGVTKRAWCAEHGIKERALHYWQRKFRQEALAMLPNTQDAISEKPPVVSETAFVDISSVVPSGSSAAYSPLSEPAIHIRYGMYEVSVNDNASRDTFRMIMEVLRND